MRGVGVDSLSWRTPVSLPSARSMPIADWPSADGFSDAVHAVCLLPPIASLRSAGSAPGRVCGFEVFAAAGWRSTAASLPTGLVCCGEVVSLGLLAEEDR